ncbi:MAG: hypothetical protein U1E61_05925 [Bradyrhizobium sp.]
MARHFTLMAISICSALLAPAAGLAQSDQESRCFPWQELRDGACVATPTRAPAPGQSRQLTTTPRDEPVTTAPVTAPAAAAVPAAPAAAPLGAAVPAATPAAPSATASPAVAILCDGGTATGSTCSCPGGYTLLPATIGSGGTCVRSNAENCQGGVLTVAGVCLCDGRVTMSGEIYALEFLGGKCVPKRCPDQTYLRDGKCVASNDTRFSFTCRTGYIPDDRIASTATDGLRCVPDPTFCPADAKRKGGTCAASSAIGIACFEGRCICGPHADWVNYLCQCTEPYHNVNGTCVTTAAGSAEDKTKQELQSSEPQHKRTACVRGTVRTAAGNCVAARPHLPSAGELGLYYDRAQRYREYPPRQPYNMR